MKDIYYPGIQNYSEDTSYKPALYSNKEFEKLTASLPLYDTDKKGFTQLLSDLQGNILMHHKRECADCYLFHFKKNADNIKAALKWIEKMAQKLTCADEEFAEENRYRDKKKENEKKGRKENVNRAPICCFYLTWKGYSALGLEHFTPLDHKAAFQEGPRERNLNLFNKDTRDVIWNSEEDVHAVLMIAYDKEDPAFVARVFGTVDIDKAQVTENNSRDIGWAFVTKQGGFLKKNNSKVVEWFGFRDGISQPLFFPDLQQIPQFHVDDLSPLRVVLVKDRGGKSAFSAGSFMAFLKIRQDVKAFQKIEKFIATYTTFYGIETFISQKRIKDVIEWSHAYKLIALDEAAEQKLIADIQTIIPDHQDRIDALKLAITELTSKPAILERILGNRVRRLFSIKEKEKSRLFEAIRKKIDEVIDAGSKPVDFEALCQTYNKSIEILESRAEIAFVNDEVIGKIIDEITKGVRDDGVRKGVLKVYIDNIFSIDEVEKRNLIEEVEKNPLPLITSVEMENLIRDNIELAGAYVIGRFRDGTPVGLSKKPSDNKEKDPDNAFSYHKNYISNGAAPTTDEGGMRCPFAAHIRKVDPREEQQKRLIVRRGMLYGDRNAKDKDIASGDPNGMLFMCFQSNLAEQFEYIIKNWMNNVQFGKQATGVDMLAGTGIDRRFSRWYIPLEWGGKNADEKMLFTAAELEPCIEYLWGEYFFAPSVSFLQRITMFNRHEQADISVAKRSVAPPPPQTTSISANVSEEPIVDKRFAVRPVALVNDKAIFHKRDKRNVNKD